MKVLMLALLLLLTSAGCDKREKAAATQPAIAPVVVQPAVSTLVPLSSSVSPPSNEPVPVPEQAVVISATTPIAEQSSVNVYKCKTEQGVTFSDAPCGENQEQLSVRETTVIDNTGLREKATQWEQQDAIEAANRTAIRAAETRQVSTTQQCVDSAGNQVACSNASGSHEQYSPSWYGDPYYNPYDGHYGQGNANHHPDGRYRDIAPASEDGRYDARDRVIESRFQDPSRTIKKHLGTSGQ